MEKKQPVGRPLGSTLYKDDPVERVSISIPRSLLFDLRQRAQEQERPYSQLATAALRQYLRRRTRR